VSAQQRFESRLVARGEKALEQLSVRQPTPVVLERSPAQVKEDAGP
jgi:hypothetical protein